MSIKIERVGRHPLKNVGEELRIDVFLVLGKPLIGRD